MACRVTLCNSKFASVKNVKIDIEAYDPPGMRSIDKQSNQSLSSGSWGANLTVASTDIYDVVIHTAGTSYSPPVLENFSGAGSPQLDVVLFSNTAATQAGSTGAAPTTAQAVYPFVHSQPWPDEAKQAVFTAIATLSYLNRLQRRMAMPVSVPIFPALRSQLTGLLGALLIDPDLIP
jgi:hypothetical protein